MCVKIHAKLNKKIQINIYLFYNLLVRRLHHEIATPVISLIMSCSPTLFRISIRSMLI